MATRQSKPDPKVGFETWTPAMAESALSKNEVNRNVRHTKVEQYARDMLSGKWNPHASMIVFDSDGKLIDGQHRLTAQVKADIKMRWLVQREADPAAQTVIDTNIPRSIADILHFGGERSSQLLAAITRLVHLIKASGLSRGRYSVSTEEVLTTLEEHPEIRVSTEIAYWFNSKKMIPLPPSVVGAAHWMIGQVNGREEADAFVHRMATLTNEKEGSPVLALARRVNEIKRNQQRVNSRDLLNLILKSWNYDAENKTVNKLALYSKSGEFKLVEVKERTSPLEEPEDHSDEDEPVKEKVEVDQ